MKHFWGRLFVPVFGTFLTWSAQAEGLSWYLYPSAYYASPDSDLHARDDYGFQFTLGAQIDPHWGVEVLSETSNFKYKDNSATISQRGVSVQGLFVPYPELPLAPFFSLGGGWLHTRTGDLHSQHDDTPLARGGVGVQWLSQTYPIGVRADAAIRHEVSNGTLPQSTNSSNFIYNLGLEYRFGGGHGFDGPAKPAASVPPFGPASTVTPAAVAPTATKPLPQTAATPPRRSTSKPDADGDGIPDAVDKCSDTPSRAVVDEDGCTLYLKPH